MRFLLASAAAIAAFTAAPAFAQYGGSPAEQVDGAPGEAVAAPEAGPPDEDVPSYENEEEAVPAGKEQAGEDYALADVDTDADIDADMDTDLDADDEGQGVPAPIPDDSADSAGETVEDEAPEPEGATWRGEDGRAYCRRPDGTTGLVVGGGAGALVGRGIDGGRNRAAGTIIGGLIGAIVGSAVERNAAEQRCR